MQHIKVKTKFEYFVIYIDFGTHDFSLGFELLYLSNETRPNDKTHVLDSHDKFLQKSLQV